MIPALFTAVLIACSGPRPGACVPVDLGTYANELACNQDGLVSAVRWLQGHPTQHMSRISCKRGEKDA